MTGKRPSKGASSPPLHESKLLGWRSSLLTQHVLPGLLATLRRGRLVLQHHGGHVSPAAVLAHQRRPGDVRGVCVGFSSFGGMHKLIIYHLFGLGLVEAGAGGGWDWAKASAGWGWRRFVTC